MDRVNVQYMYKVDTTAWADKALEVPNGLKKCR